MRAIFGSIFIIFWLVCILIGGILWPYSIEHLALMFMHKTVIVPFWAGVLLGLVPIASQATIPIAIITYILTLIF